MKEELEHIRLDLVESHKRIGRAIDTVDLALQSLTPLTDLTVEWENGDIRVRWKAEEEGTFDLVYQATVHDKWFSYKKNVAPIDLKDETAVIGVNINETFTVKAVYEGEVIDEALLDKRTEAEEETEEETEEELSELPDDFITTLWDSWNNGYQDFNAIKLRNVYSIDKHYDGQKTVIASLSHRWTKKDKDDNYVRDENGHKILEPEWKWEQRLRNVSQKIEGLNPNKYLVLLQDEPLSKPHWNLSSVNRLIELSRDILPQGAKIGMAFTNGSVNKRELPKGLNFYCTGNYHFKTEYAVSIGHHDVKTKEEYDKETDDLTKRLRRKVGKDKDIYLLGQGFYNPNPDDDSLPNNKRRWRKPPKWYIEAIYEACQRLDLKGVWWWLYEHHSDGIVSLKQMPELYDKIKNIA